jgi:hypothetical protein
MEECGEVLPPGWAWANLAQLASLAKNAITDGPFGSNLKTEHYTTSGPRVIRLQNIGDGRFRDIPAHISEERFETLAKHGIQAGDLAIATLGEILPRACVIPDGIGPALVKADCIRFQPHATAVLAAYLSYALNSPDTRKRVSSTIHGVGRPRLRLADIKAISDLPELPKSWHWVNIDQLIREPLRNGHSAKDRFAARAGRHRYRDRRRPGGSAGAVHEDRGSTRYPGMRRIGRFDVSTP